MTARTHSAVVEFPQARVRPAATLPDGASADVVIFTGVRIERLCDLTDEPSHVRKRQRRSSAKGDFEFGR